MNDIPSAYLIDDGTYAIELFELLKKIAGFQEAVSISLREAFDTTGKTVDDVATCCVEKVVSTSSLLCVVFLDLELGLKEKIEQDSQEELRSNLNLDKYAQKAALPYQGLAVANRIIELLPKDFSKRLLFMIQTKGDEVPLPRIENQRILFGQIPSVLGSLDHFASTRLRAFPLVEPMQWQNITEETTRNLVINFRNVVGYFKGRDNSVEWWMRKWLLHKDNYVAGLLNDYLDPFRAGIRNAWTHDWTEHEDGLQAGSRILGIKPDPESNKALFMRDTNDFIFHPEAISRDLDPAVLQKVLDRLKIEATLNTLTNRFFKLPSMPGIGFLLALKALLNELAVEAPALRVEFQLDGSSYGVQILLGSYIQKDGTANQKGHGCVRRFLEKMRLAGEQATDGVSGAIFGAAHCRLNGLENPEDEPWVKMLNGGLTHWCAWPSFLENGIEFRW